MQTLAVSIIGAIITAVGVWIAIAQMVIAHDRFEIDAFDRQYTRRVTVYEATREFLEGAFRGTLSDTDIRAYGLCTLDAQFLFDENMYKYLRELCWRVTSWIETKIFDRQFTARREQISICEASRRASGLDYEAGR